MRKWVQGGGLLGLEGVVLVGVARRDRVDEVDDDVQPRGLRHGRPHAPTLGLVAGVGEAELVNAVGREALQPHLVQGHRGQVEGGERPAADDAQGSVSGPLGDLAYAFPGIFLQFPHDLLAGVAVDLDGLEAGVVQVFDDGGQHARPGVLRPEAVGAVPDSRVGEADF